MSIIKSPEGDYFEFQFQTTFEETNLVGNIYFANYVLWQGKCREMFLYEYCPEVIEEINNGLALITLDLSVQYYSQLFAFDKVVMKMSLQAQSTSRLMMHFDYYGKNEDGTLRLIAKGSQATAAMRHKDGKLEPTHFPESLYEVFEKFEITTPHTVN